MTLRDLFTWLWPRYWDREKWNKQAQAWGDWAGGYDRSKHLEPLRRALIELDNLRILYDRYERRLIRVETAAASAGRGRRDLARAHRPAWRALGAAKYDR